MEPVKRSRDYCFTVNNWTGEDQDMVYACSYDPQYGCRYIVVGQETGESGTPHLQGFICFKEAKSLKQMQDMWPRGHFEPRRGTYKQASDYCKKDDVGFFEWGTLPADPAVKGVKGREAFEAMMVDAIKQIEQGDYEGVAASMTCHLKAIEYRIHKTRQQARNLETYQGDLQAVNYWYYGAAGTGKSRKAREENPDAYLKMCNKWWDGYCDEETVLIEDFDKKHDVLVHHMKVWADRYAFKAEIKGGCIDIRPKKIVVTSNYHPRDIWQDDGDLLPILRRFKVVHFDVFPRPPNPPNVPMDVEEF